MLHEGRPVTDPGWNLFSDVFFISGTSEEHDSHLYIYFDSLFRLKRLSLVAFMFCQRLFFTLNFEAVLISHKLSGKVNRWAIRISTFPQWQIVSQQA